MVSHYNSDLCRNERRKIMAKGSVRKKGKKWYYRFYVEDENGNRIQQYAQCCNDDDLLLFFSKNLTR